jgi:PTH1 family peptidyl-tRNA hydrolase
VGPLAGFYKIPLPSVLVIADDVELPFGTLRMRGKGSPGGHNGLKSIEQRLGSDQYPRLKVGVGRNDHTAKSLANHVLGKFSSSERELLEYVIERAADQIDVWLRLGLIEAMNRYNGSGELGAK